MIFRLAHVSKCRATGARGCPDVPAAFQGSLPGWQDRRLAKSEEPPPGAHPITPRVGYVHHGIYLGSGKVIHCGAVSCLIPRGPVEEATLRDFRRGRPVAVRVAVPAKYDSREIIARARSRLGEDRYRLLSNNCEHFCEWCVRGEQRSYQVERVMRWMQKLRILSAAPTGGRAGTLGLLWGIALVLLAGCVVGPNYEPPDERAPAKWATHLAAGESVAPAALAHWWTSFKDPELDTLIGTAVRSNLTLRVAEDRVREARAEREVTAGGRWPSAGASMAYSRNRYGANSYPPLGHLPGVPLNYNLYTVGFDAAWELDLFGGVRRAVEASSAEVGAAEYARRDVLVSVLAEVGRNYIDARAYQERLAITRRNVVAEQGVLALTRSRYRSGLASDLEVEQASAILTTTEARLPAIESRFAQSVHHLSVVLGENPGAMLDEMSRVAPIPLTPPVVPVGLPSDLLRRRPDVERAERELAAATAEIGAAEAELFPKVSLMGALGVTSTSTSNLLEYASRYWSAGPALQWNILEGGRLRANVRVQKARAAQALDTYRQTVLVALEDAENALIAYSKERIRRRWLAQSVQSSEAAFRLSSERYRSGLVDFLNVLDAERTLYAAQDALVESTKSVSLDLVQLYKALGGGWQLDSSPPSVATTAAACSEQCGLYSVAASAPAVRRRAGISMRQHFR